MYYRVLQDEQLARDLEARRAEILGPQQYSDTIRQLLQEEVAAADRINQRFGATIYPIGKSVTVNNVRAGGFEGVLPGSTVIVEWQLVGPALTWIAQALRERSPVASGAYRGNHLLLADGAPASPGSAPPAKEYVFINTEPYARKIEIGITHSGRAFEVRVENRIYQRTAADAARQFPGVSVAFEFREAAGAAGARDGLVYPAIIVKPGG